MTTTLDHDGRLKRLQDLRAEKGFSQKAFADWLGMPFRTYQGYETGERALSIALVDKLVARGYNPTWLLQGVGPATREVDPGDLAVQVLDEIDGALAGAGLETPTEGVRVLIRMAMRRIWTDGRVPAQEIHQAVNDLAPRRPRPALKSTVGENTHHSAVTP